MDGVMARFSHEHVLLVGDLNREVQSALSQALPGAQLTAVGSMFDAIAELSAGSFTTVMASAEPIERRPESAARVLRQLAGAGRVVIFGHPASEPMSRRLLDFGCDDYIVLPPETAELQQLFGTSPLRMSDSGTPIEQAEDQAPAPLTPTESLSVLLTLPLAEMSLDALLQHPADAPAALVQQINNRIAPMMHLSLLKATEDPPATPEGTLTLSHLIRLPGDEEDMLVLHLMGIRENDETAARHFLAQLAQLMSRLQQLHERHSRLQKLAITDELTGLYNGRYFRHFLTRIVERARTMRFPVTLLLFDIDNFKKYNDQYGHGVGDEILKQTSALMRKCVRDHDLVARISGDEFAVVFWEKDGPRQPRNPNSVTGSRVPSTPLIVFQRFQRMLLTQHFEGLGPTGQGQLTISGGLAVYPFDAQSPQDLITAADHALMFGAKQSGKNSCFLVGGQDIGEK